VTATPLEFVSIEPSRRCTKGCSFCYNGSSAANTDIWPADELRVFCIDLAANGVRALSFGGGEPLEYPPMFELLDALGGVVPRTLTTNGLPLERGSVFERLVGAAPEKVHVSIHAPENLREVARVVDQVLALGKAGLRSGVNFLVRGGHLDEATRAAAYLYHAGITPEQITFLPMRGSPLAHENVTPKELAAVAQSAKFASMTCLRGCEKSRRFASVAADKTVAWCSYTVSRVRLADLSHAALVAALAGRTAANVLGAAARDDGEEPGDELGLRPCSEESLVPRRSPRTLPIVPGGI